MKARSDSKLKNLPEETQALIISWCKQEGDGGGYAGAQTKCWQDLAIKVSISTLGEFFGWWHLQQRFASASSRADQIEELVSKKFPNMDPERIRAFGQSVFMLEAVENGNVSAYVELESLKLAQDSAKFKGQVETEKLKLSREKFEVQTCERFIKWFADHKAQAIMKSNASNAEKIAALRQTYFADVDELEKSGTVVLPE